MQAQAYRPDIDGLRAVAIIMVLGFHAFPSIVPGGFVGVDVFFVISGFLITGIITSQQFSLTWFYARRIRRIFPALIVVLTATYIGGWFLLIPPEFAQLGINTVTGALFASNIALLQQSGYFDLEAIRKPLLHLWSLGIEEQFYIVWPLLLLVARKRGMLLTALLAVGSFSLNLWLMHDWQRDAAFYLPFSRAFELLIGAGLTFVKRAPFRRSDLIAGSGLLLIGIAAVFARPISFPGLWAAVPTTGAALLLIAGRSTLNRWLLSNRVSVAIGKISYPLYLWHWPLIVYGALVLNPFDTNARLALIGLAVVLSVLTYWLVEMPIRTGKRGAAKVTGLSFAMAAVIAAAGAAVLTAGLPQRFPRDVRDALATETDTSRWRPETCMLTSGSKFSDSCLEKGTPLLFLWGDSTAGALVPGILDLQQNRTFALGQFTASSCEPVFAGFMTAHCNEVNESVLEVLKGARPDIVLLEAIWHPSLEHLNALGEIVERLRKAGVPRVVVFGRVPIWKDGVARPILEYYLNHDHQLPERLPLPVSIQDNLFNKQMREKVEAAGGTFVSVSDALCDEQRDCLVRTQGVDGRTQLVTSDQVHLTDAGSHYLISKLQDEILPAVPRP